MSSNVRARCFEHHRRHDSLSLSQRYIHRSHLFLSVKLLMFLHLASSMIASVLFVWYKYEGDKNTLHLNERAYAHSVFWEDTLHFCWSWNYDWIHKICKCTSGSLIFIWFSRSRRRRRRERMTKRKMVQC